MTVHLVLYPIFYRLVTILQKYNSHFQHISEKTNNSTHIATKV